MYWGFSRKSDQEVWVSRPGLDPLFCRLVFGLFCRWSWPFFNFPGVPTPGNWPRGGHNDPLGGVERTPPEGGSNRPPEGVQLTPRRGSREAPKDPPKGVSGGPRRTPLTGSTEQGLGIKNWMLQPLIFFDQKINFFWIEICNFWFEKILFFFQKNKFYKNYNFYQKISIFLAKNFQFFSKKY